MKTSLNRKNVFSIYKDAPPPKLKKEIEPQKRIIERVPEQQAPQIERKQDQIIVNPTPVIVNFPEPKPESKPEPKKVEVKEIQKPKVEPKKEVPKSKKKIFPIGDLELEKTIKEVVQKPIYVSEPRKAPKPKSAYRATGMDILEMGDKLKKLKTWEDFSSFLSTLSSKNLTLMAKGQASPLDNFTFDGKWLMFTVSGVKSKQVIPGLWKTAIVGRVI